MTRTRRPGLSVRLKLTLSYTGFLMLAWAGFMLVLAFVLRYLPDANLVDVRGGTPAPNRSDLAEAADPGPVATVDPGAKLMSVTADITTLALLALSLQVLLASLAALVWAWHRWSRVAAWVAGGPCVLAALWLVSSIGSRLLPALI